MGAGPRGRGQLTWRVAAHLVVAGFLSGAGVSLAQPLGGPPPEAFAACGGKDEASVCSFRAPHGTVAGTCRTMRGRSVCVPTHPPGGSQDMQGRGRGAGMAGPMGGPMRGYTPRKPFPDAVPLANRVPDTGQVTCFDDRRPIDCPDVGAPFHGQDAHYRGRPPAYRVNGDGTVSDLVTGLMWQKAHNPRRLGFTAAKRACEGLALGGHGDWRLPTIKELFSISHWQGVTGRRFFLDGSVFDLELPGPEILRGDRFAATHRVDMMGQTWSATLYTGDHWDRPGVEAAFFFNFLDGRIKQAPTGGRGPGLFHRCVRGPEWGVNDFRAHGDGTVTDTATGLMWQQADDGRTRTWGQALAYCQGLSLAGHGDWRLPNAKELQSLVDYRRHDPALDLTVFRQHDKTGWFWSSTTHGDNPGSAVYVCFGKCISVDGVDVHGAGAQRSDPKAGDPSRWGPMGGQRDQVRIHNHARCVRDADPAP